MTPEYITFSNIIIDDIVLPDGSTFMGTLGGAGTHALIGMRVWNDRLGFVATVGPNFDNDYRAQLQRLDLDMRGVVTRRGYQTAQAWQLFEPDERRIEVFRTDPEQFHTFAPRFEDMPADYRRVSGVHADWGKTIPALITLLDQFKRANPDVSIVCELTMDQMESGTPEEMQDLFQIVDLFSPDEEGAEILTGHTDRQTIIDTLLNWGAPLVALRIGEEGSLVCTAGGEKWRVPAVPPAKLVDVTGAGNAYCGGFLVGLGEGLAPRDAALRAAVSASFALEQFGVPTFDEETRREAERRLEWANEHLERVS